MEGSRKITVACVKYWQVQLTIGFLHSNNQSTSPMSFVANPPPCLCKQTKYYLVIYCRPYCSNYGCYSCTELCATSSGMFLEVVTGYYGTKYHFTEPCRHCQGRWRDSQEVNHKISFKNNTCITLNIKDWWCITVYEYLRVDFSFKELTFSC